MLEILLDCGAPSCKRDIGKPGTIVKEVPPRQGTRNLQLSKKLTILGLEKITRK